jgi:hypothetical protein
MPNPDGTLTPEQMIAAIERVFAVAAQMSNVCHNLAQNASTEPRNRDVLNDLWRQWDATAGDRKAVLASLRSQPPEGLEMRVR